MPEIPFEIQYPTVSSFFEQNGDFPENFAEEPDDTYAYMAECARVDEEMYGPNPR